MFIENFQRRGRSLDAEGCHIGFEGVYGWCLYVRKVLELLLQIMALVPLEEPREMWSQLA